MEPTGEAWECLKKWAHVYGEMDYGIHAENGLVLQEIVISHNGTSPEFITWDTLLANYSQVYDDVALELVNEMKSLGFIPEMFKRTSMISGWADGTNQGLEVFKQLLVVKVYWVTSASSIPDKNSGGCLELMKKKLEPVLNGVLGAGSRRVNGLH